MPLYEYRCRSCHHPFEVLQRMGEEGEGLACPECGEPSPEKQLSTFSASASNGSSTPAAVCGAPACGSGFT